MNESVKTVIFFGVAALVAATVWITTPRPMASDIGEKVGKPLFSDFENAFASIEIVEFDEDNADRRVFDVAKVDVDGKPLWSIPSHEDYPADAERQLAETAAAMVDLTVLEIADKDPAEHETYGVIDPDPDLLKSGATGVGDRVTIKDKKGKTLMSLIIGKEVPVRPNSQEDLRYVRVTGEDPVYVVALDAKKLSTKFNDWIEPDLLKINTWDIKQLWFRDYTVIPEQGAIELRGDVTVEYNETADPKWKLLRNMAAAPTGQLVDEKMPKGMELDGDKLDEAKNSLDDLQIVDVRRKPEGLSADLKADENLAKNRETRQALQGCGFYVAEYGGRVEIFSDQGEIRCLMKDGVEYILRFGSIDIGSNPRTDEEEGEDEAGSLGLNRFLFVTVEFSADAVTEPQFEIPPEAQPKPKNDGVEKSEEEKKKEDAEIERIKKDNQRKQDDYDETVKKGKQRAKELNGRFADWYYIISNKTFQKIHLSRSDIFKKESQPDANGGHGGPMPGLGGPMPGHGGMPGMPSFGPMPVPDHGEPAPPAPPEDKPTPKAGEPAPPEDKPAPEAPPEDKPAPKAGEPALPKDEPKPSDSPSEE